MTIKNVIYSITLEHLTEFIDTEFGSCLSGLIYTVLKLHFKINVRNKLRQQFIFHDLCHEVHRPVDVKIRFIHFLFSLVYTYT